MEERLQKIIAAAGFASRRAAEELIKAGKVQVDGKVVKELGTKVDPAKAMIRIEGKILPPKPEAVAYLLYKPKGVVSSTKKQANERIVTDLVPKTPPVYPIGRLDQDTEGLIILTNDGELANTLTHPSYKHTKQYTVKAKWKDPEKAIAPEKLEAKLRKGVKLGDGLAKADHASIKQNEGEVVLILTVHEGRHHLIRRMCATIGLDVTQLVRTKIANLTVQKLKSGDYRALSPHEVRNLA
jgi:23S rRNA pseudouridine2605 synthase